MQGIVRALAVAAVLLTGVTPSGAEAKRKPREVWTVARMSDPITGDTSCVVTAYDTAAGIKFSRFGFLYPVVESNSTLGLLIGVSSGGQFRVPTGDILWRVDDRPFRTLRAADNPATPSALAAYKTGNPATDARIAEAMASASKTTASFTATSTVASGEIAKEMLAEMVAGRSLIYRQASVAPSYGLPSGKTDAVGQLTQDGLVPFALDDSFRRGLATCGILPAGG